jgi:hypothetical protein
VAGKYFKIYEVSLDFAPEDDQGRPKCVVLNDN